MTKLSSLFIHYFQHSLATFAYFHPLSVSIYTLRLLLHSLLQHKQLFSFAHNTLATFSLTSPHSHITTMSSNSHTQDFKNPLLHQEEDKNTLIMTAAAKGAGLALVAGGLVALSGARYSKAYQTLSRPMKTFLLGSGTLLFYYNILLSKSLDRISY